jgi:DNA repair protein RadC
MDDSAHGLALLRDLPADEKPRERLALYGPENLRSEELIAILLRTGTRGKDVMAVSKSLLDQFGLAGLANATVKELVAAEDGIGPAKASELRAAMVLGLRATKEQAGRKPLRNPEDVAVMLSGEMSLLDREEVRVVALDVRLKPLGIANMYQGSAHTTQVRYGELFRSAIRLNASAMVVVHNHPSGDPSPSSADIAMTKGLVASGQLLDIEVHDHIIIGGGDFVSMRRLGLGFEKT